MRATKSILDGMIEIRTTEPKYMDGGKITARNPRVHDVNDAGYSHCDIARLLGNTGSKSLIIPCR